MKTQLNYAKEYIDEALRRLEATPDKNAISDLLQAIKSIDLQYEDFCAEFDDDFGEPEGTTYDKGVSIEFYIEADAWHSVSLALRKLEKQNGQI